MSAPKKLLIVTSNEDVIRQFTSHQMKDTYIIDLDNEKQLILNEENNHDNTSIIANLSTISQLTALNSSKEQDSKPLLDSSDRLCKSLKATKNREEYVCAVCGDHAIGYNYDVLSCAPCKIFFRRNANQDPRSIKCLSGTYQCSIDCKSRRKCPRCRLTRCFAMGMKKQYLLTEEEKQQRKSKTNEQTHQSVAEMRSTSVCEILSSEDRRQIEKIHSSFLSIVEERRGQCACADVQDRTSALIAWSEYLQKVTLSFIQFFRQLDHFERLNFDDRLILIKYNILPVTVILKSYYYRPNNDCCSDDDSEPAMRQRRFYLLCSGTTETRAIFVDLVVSLAHVTKQDPTLVSLLSVLLIFSRGLAMDDEEPFLKDSHAVHQAQCYYAKLLWNYLVHQLGQNATEKYFVQLITVILKIQSASRKLRQYFHTQFTTPNIVEQMAPVIQSVLRI